VHPNNDHRPARLSLEELEEILIYFSTSMFGKNTEEDILWDLAKNCISRLGFVDCVVYLVDETRGVLVQMAALGPKNPQRYEILDRIDIPLGKGITGHTALTGQAQLIPDTSKDPRYIVDDEVRLSEICVPIKLDNRVLGLIDSEHPEKGYFHEQHLRVLSAIASICAIKLQRVRAEAQAREEQQKRFEAQQLMNDLKARALRAQLSPHFVFNALNAIQHFITSDDKTTAIRFLSLFSKLIRYHLNAYEKDTVALDKELDMLEWYLRLQQLRYEDRFVYQIERNTGTSGVHIPSLILSSLTEFAVEQSMFLQTGKSHLNLRVEQLEHTVELHVEFGPIHPEIPHPDRAVNYREELSPWDEQARLINRIKGYNIQTSSTMEPDGDAYKALIRLSLPVVTPETVEKT
jgi:putative methionine-R-sulfoxide reductase with GAF domain